MATQMWSSPSHFASTTTREHYAIVAKELHDKLLAAGLIVAPDAGQLDFDTLTGAIGDAQSLGFRIYQLNDGNDLPLFLKIEFRTAGSGASTNAMYALNLSIGFATNGNGVLVGGTGISRVGMGNTWADRATGSPDQPSCVCVTSGFIGVQWKEGYIQPSTIGPSSAVEDAPTLASFFVCRDTDDTGAPTSEGASLVTVGGDGKSYSFFGGAPRVRHLSAGGVEHQTQRACLAIGSDTTLTIGGAVPVYNIYTPTPAPVRLAQIGCAPRRSMGDKDEMQLALKGTQARNFLALPKAWPGDILTGTSTQAGIVMLWE